MIDMPCGTDDDGFHEDSVTDEAARALDMPGCPAFRGCGKVLMMDELNGFDRLEQQKLVTIETFRDLTEALLAKGRLEAADIDSCLADENLVRMDWFLANAIGGIKLKVPEEQAAEAFRVLFTEKYRGPQETRPQCPKCGSSEVSVVDPDKGFRLAVLWMFALPTPRVGEVQWRCAGCGAAWVEEEESGLAGHLDE